jgi:hypothetical protein
MNASSELSRQSREDAGRSHKIKVLDACVLIPDANFDDTALVLVWRSRSITHLGQMALAMFSFVTL